MSNKKIFGDKKGAIGWLVFNNPEKRNAISLDMAKMATQILDEFSNDDSIRVVILRGEGGKSFVSGQDISEFEKLRSTPEGIANYEKITNGMYQGVRDLKKPSIAMIDGFCMGGGVALACACDFRIATENSIFAVPAARLGITYRPNFTRWVVETVGITYAKEILMTGMKFSAKEARVMGLINQLVEPDSIVQFLEEYGERLANNAPLSVESSKVIIEEVGKIADNWDEEKCISLMNMCSNSEDYKEGRRAFMEKRTPNFKGI